MSAGRNGPKFPRALIAILLPNAGRCRWLNSARHPWHAVPIWEPPVTYQWLPVHSGSIQSCTVYPERPLTDAACPRGPSICDSPPDIVYSYLCFYHVSDVHILANAPTRLNSLRAETHFRGLDFILLYARLNWTETGAFSPTNSCFGSSNNHFLLIINHTMISAPPIIKGNYSRPRLQHLHQGGNAFFPVPLFKSESDTINQHPGHI